MSEEIEKEKKVLGPTFPSGEIDLKVQLCLLIGALYDELAHVRDLVEKLKVPSNATRIRERVGYIEQEIFYNMKQIEKFKAMLEKIAAYQGITL